MAEEPEQQPSASQPEKESNGILQKMADAVPQGSNTDSEEKPAEKSTETPNESQQPAPEEKKPSKLKQLWQKAGLDMMTLKMMVKGSLPPTIAIAIYQSKGVEEVYQTLGYLVAIASVLGFCIMPRAKFMQNLVLNTFAICLGAAVNLLALFSVTQARVHTAPPGAPPTAYNSSASAVSAIWLMVQVFGINYLKAARPQFMFPVILYSIFTIVSLSYGSSFPDMPYAVSFELRLLEAFLSGFALATGVHFFVFPLSSRTVIFKEMTGYMMLLNGVLKTQTAYMASLENIEPGEGNEQHEEAGQADGKRSKRKKRSQPQGLLTTPASVKLKEMMTKLAELHAKIRADLEPAKREIAFGKLESHDLTELFRLLSLVFIPVMGLTSIMYVLERQAEVGGWRNEDPTESQQKARHHQLDSLHFLMKELRAPFASMMGVLDGAFHHVLLTLELVKPPKKKKGDDEESKAGADAAPGTPGFVEEYEKKVDNFYASKQHTLRDWCHEHGIDLPEDFFESSFIRPEDVKTKNKHKHDHYQRQLFFTLYLEYLLWRVSTSVLDLILYVERRKQEGAFKKSRLIFPGSRTMREWHSAIWSKEDITQEDSYIQDMDTEGVQDIDNEYMIKKDPEHLPPRNNFEKVGNAIRLIPKFFRSDSAAFGFRVACATMTIAIVDFLEVSHPFFLKQRLQWAMIMIAISMSRTAGQSTFNFVLRVFGTFVAMVAAYIIWYIVDGKTPGAIVFLWLWMTCAFYIVLKMPKFVIIGVLSVVTSVLIIGYELQVVAIGKKLAQKSGQPAYPTYELAPYRLATVAGGLFVAYFWTVFPYPISEGTELRKDLGAMLYLLASFNGVIKETIRSRVKGNSGDRTKKGTHAYNLEKARMKVFSKLVLILTNLRTNSAFSKFQLRIGGRFPSEEYNEIIECVSRLLSWLTLMSYSSTTFQESDTSEQERSAWSHDFRHLLSIVNPSAAQVTSLFCLLSSSLSNNQPLPPYLEKPEPYKFVKSMEAIDADILSIRHIVEPEYSAFAVMQVVSQCVNSDLEKLTQHVKNLVGEIDFSYKTIKSSAASIASTAVDSDDDKGKVD